MSDSWREHLLSATGEDEVWELFHENSKLGRSTPSVSDEQVVKTMSEFAEALPFIGYPIVDLPECSSSMKLSLDEAVISRSSVRELARGTIPIQDLARLLQNAYGRTRDNKGTGLPRPFRAVPSAGALYPLELLLFCTQVEGLQAGLYQYNPTKNHLRLLNPGDHTEVIAGSFVQADLARGASLIIFITALFERTTFKYGNRGYRFVLLEAGHVTQNINLVATAMGLGSVNIGGFFDREIDDYLGLDGIRHSTVYITCIGNRLSTT